MTAADVLVSGLFDDASMFPPATLPIETALQAHRDHKASSHADVVGAFIVSPSRLCEVPAGFEVAVSGQADDIGRALAGDHQATVVAVEAAGPVTDVLDLMTVDLLTGRLGYAEIEVRRDPAEVLADLDALVGRSVLAKFRTGGTTNSAFPTEAELAVAIHGCARRGLAFKFTAGLHDPARHRDPATGFEHHGLLNVILATDLADRVASVDEVGAALGQRDEQGLSEIIRDMSPERLRRVRGTFVCVGTCSIDECLAGLARVGVWPPSP